MIDTKELLINLDKLTDGERIEMIKLGMLSEDNRLKEYAHPTIHRDRPPIPRHAIHAPEVINEAYSYTKPSSFSRALSSYRISSL